MHLAEWSSAILISAHQPPLLVHKELIAGYGIEIGEN